MIITFKLSMFQTNLTSTKPMGNKRSGRGAGEKKLRFARLLF